MLRSAAAWAAGGQQYPAAALYVVATPIGNLADLSLRAVHVLGLVDAVACEDTRRTGALLTHLDITRPLLAVHAHNEHEACAAVLQRLAAGQRIALACDAGTPAVSDPGAVLVGAVHRAGFRVVPVPGASSVLAAISAAGETAAAGPAPPVAEGFVFVGFLPARGGPRRQALEKVLGEARTQVVFEAPHRMTELARDLAAQASERRVTLCRELTKQFEQVLTLPAGELPAWLASDPARSRGEFVLVLHRPRSTTTVADEAVPAHALQTLTVLMQELPLKQSVALAARISGVGRNVLYEAALQLHQAPP